MQTIASMREYINEYVRSQSVEEVGREILEAYFGIPFSFDGDSFAINHVPMSVDEARDYVKSFFEELDTTAVIELYNNIKA